MVKKRIEHSWWVGSLVRWLVSTSRWFSVSRFSLDTRCFRHFGPRSYRVKVQPEKSGSTRTDLTAPAKLFVELWNVVRGRFSWDNELLCTRVLHEWSHSSQVRSSFINLRFSLLIRELVAWCIARIFSEFIEKYVAYIYTAYFYVKLNLYM